MMGPLPLSKFCPIGSVVERRIPFAKKSIGTVVDGYADFTLNTGSRKETRLVLWETGDLSWIDLNKIVEVFDK